MYVFGGAIQTGTENYVNYLLPGILLGLALLFLARKLRMRPTQVVTQHSESEPRLAVGLLGKREGEGT